MAEGDPGRAIWPGPYGPCVDTGDSELTARWEAALSLRRK
jgi:hypothetical protein